MNVGDEDIEFVEAETRKIGQSLQIKLDESIGKGMQNEVDSDHLIETFGKTYAINATDFQFLRGEKLLIKELVGRIQSIVNARGLKTFGCKVKKKNPKRQCIGQKNVPREDNAENFDANNNMKIDDGRIPELKLDLFQRVQSCFDQCQAEFEYLDENSVNVVVQKNGQIYGSVICEVCRELEFKRQQPKRVYYHQSPEACYWMLSNLLKHLSKVHNLTPMSGWRDKPYKKRTHGKKSTETEDVPKNSVQSAPLEKSDELSSWKQ